MKFALISLLLLQGALSAQTIAEKKNLASQKESGNDVALDSQLLKLNQELSLLRTELEKSYIRVKDLYQNEADEEQFSQLLGDVNRIKSRMLALENHWRKNAVSEAKKEEEGYALWDQEETTLAQLVMEYGAMDYLYVIPPEISGLKLHMHSGIPVPRESWNDLLEIVLAQNGIGIKKINPYARQLFILKQDLSAVQFFASNREDLLFIPSQSRMFYVLSPPAEQIKSVYQFFERFSDPKQTFFYQVGPKIAIASSKEEIEKLLSLYDTVWEGHPGKISRVVSVTKMSVKEMEKILQSFFGDVVEKARAPFGKIDQEGLAVFPLGQGNALVLIGSQAVVDRAEKIVKDTEQQLLDPTEMTVFLYQCKHSDPVDLSKVLEKVYSSLLQVAPENSKEVEVNYAAQGGEPKTFGGYAPQQPLVVPPQQFKPGVNAHVEVEEGGSDHFIPDPKTGTLLMVVRRDALVKIRDLLRKLDVPKKMVQIEVLLFEKRLNTQNSFGLNLLKIGSKSNNVKFEGGHHAMNGRGILQFMFHRGASKYFPAFDFVYSFLMTQEDIQLNAAPSIITVNQTPATIAIVEEISINNGAAPVDTSNNKVVFEKSFSRAQYGITIILTPIIHMPDEEQADGKGFITLQTNVTFDTTKPSPDDRPLVDKRHIENEVRVIDGETIILGGLRRKTAIDNQEKVPFFGEIPGLGKLFGTTKLTDHNTEMFIFITPKIVLDPQEEVDRIRTEELKKRPGDLPEFLQRVVEARDKEEKRFFRNSMKIFFDSKP